MKRILALAAIAAVALMGMNCSPAASDIFPMSVGSVWNMDILVMAGTTVAALDTFQTGTSVTTAVEKANLSSGEEVVKFRTEVNVHQRTPDTTYTSTTDAYMREAGDWILSYSDLNDSTGDTVTMTNPSVGTTWHQDSTTYEVVGREDVMVTAGTYKNAWKVTMTSRMGGVTVDTHIWYAQGTGTVKTHFEKTVQTYSMVYNQELTSATIK
jgi:hypothetical protein